MYESIDISVVVISNFFHNFCPYSGLRSKRSTDFVFKSPPCSYSRMIPVKNKTFQGDTEING